MNAQAQTVFNTFQRPRRVICGVCATLSERSGLPAWIIRVAAVVLLMAHGLVTLIVYFGTAVWLRQPARANGFGSPRDYGFVGRTGPATPPPPAPPAWDRDGVVERFRRLDARLAKMELEAFHSEAGLRRAFHDLERR